MQPFHSNNSFLHYLLNGKFAVFFFLCYAFFVSKGMGKYGEAVKIAGQAVSACKTGRTP